ncbi:MAG: M14 family zinc carboxypeptidase, partial [Chloroflexota bacterium]
VTLHIIPDLNPDSPNDIGLRTGRYNANGVDLNRNWDCHHVQDPLVGGDRVPGKGGPEPFSEPETESLNNYIFEIEPAAVVFWMASFPEGAISPGGCWEPTTVSGDLATLYSNATNYVYEADYQAAVGFDINGDVSNYLDSQGFPAIAVLLRDFIEPDFQRNLMAVRSVLQNYQYGYFDETYVPETAVPDEIVFYSNRDDDFEIYIMNTNGTNQRQLTNNTAADRFPRVSPDGRRIVFESDRDGNFEIYIMNRDGSNQRRLTFNEEDDHLPSWAPDGQSIIYNASTPDREKTDLFSVSTTGGEPVQLTNTSQYNEAHPSLSTQGQLLYNRREDSSQFWQLFLANSDGSSPTLLTDDSSPNWSGEWSPDGEKIVFLSGRNSDVISGIYVMNADGSSIQPIVEDFDAWGPAWSADGTQIIYSVDQPDNSSHLYIVDINNPGSPRLIAERGGYPSWAPAISTSGTQALPTPTIPPNPTASSGSSTAGNCVENALNRWQNNIYPEFAGRLGCSTSGEKQLTGVFQIFENGLMVWRGDNNTIYVFYTQGPAINSYQIFPMDNVANVTINNERLKGSIGQLWTINGVVQSQIGAPKDAEMGMSGFVLQEFLRGAIFYFNENLSNTYILLNNPNEFRMIQEK